MAIAETSIHSPKSLWRHPVLPIFGKSEIPTLPKSPAKLYLVPTPDNLFGESSDPDFPPTPSPLTELPDIYSWVQKYALGVVEIWNLRRPAMQLARWSHRKVFAQLSAPTSLALGAKIRRIYLNQPIEGVTEATVTLLINKRVRSLSLRFEGVDKRWICTELLLI